MENFTQKTESTMLSVNNLCQNRKLYFIKSSNYRTNMNYLKYIYTFILL